MTLQTVLIGWAVIVGVAGVALFAYPKPKGCCGIPHATLPPQTEPAPAEEPEATPGE